MSIGIIKWYSNSKKYGFITETKNQKDYFFSDSSVYENDKELSIGKEVSFDKTWGNLGSKAINVKIIK